MHAANPSNVEPSPAVDSQRPQYHFMPAANWLNDPNGLIQWRGVYHMFYQYNPAGAFHDAIHWGHAMSTDLVTWTHLPIALAPTPGGPDAGGCWSGCAVDDDGVPTIIYSGHAPRAGSAFQVPCLATGDADLIEWTKYAGNPLNALPPADLDVLEFRDHSVWREADGWYMLIGSGIRGVGGAALLYRSPDLRDWEYLHPIAVGDAQRHDPIWLGSVWECPDFFAIGDRHALVVSAWDERRTFHPAYMLGTYADHRLTVERESRVDWGDSLYAPQSFTDEQGRRIMFGWLRESCGPETQRAAGWSGAMSLPRVLSLAPTGELGIAPAPEVEQLRGAHTALASIELAPDTTAPIAQVRGAQVEIKAEWAPQAEGVVGVAVRCSADSAETTLIGYDWAAGRLFVDTTRGSLSPDVVQCEQGGPLQLLPDEPLVLHIFVDASIVEVFANGRTCIAARVYPTRPDSLGVQLWTRGFAATVRQLDAWQLRSIWSAEPAG